MKPGFRYATFDTNDPAHRDTPRCGGCRHLTDNRKEKAGGWCSRKRFMTGTIYPVQCDSYEKATK